jgi:hypothetical protein
MEMQGFLHTRYFSLSVFAGIVVLTVAAVQFYLFSSAQNKRTDPNKTYSLISSGQLNLQAKSNTFSGKSAKEFKQSDIDIMKQVNTIEPYSMTQDNWLGIKIRAAEPNKENEQLDQQIELVKIKMNNYRASTLIFC